MPNKQPHPRSVRGLMARYGLSRTTVYAEIKRGHLKVTKVGARTLITEEQERAWLERSKRSA
jgi:excisionase family DNA binding protein